MTPFPFKGLVFVITGTLSHPRERFVELIEAAGGKVSNSVSRKTDYLLCGEDAGSKRSKAEVLGVKIIDKEGLSDLLQPHARTDLSLIPATFERDLLRAYQICYYVDNRSLITDYEYDMAERAFKKKTGEEIPVGSDVIEEYTPAQQTLAMYLQYAAGYQRLGRSENT